MVLTTYVGSGSPALRTFPAGLTHTVARSSELMPPPV